MWAAVAATCALAHRQRLVRIRSMPAQRVPLVRRSSICRADAEVWTSQPLIAISTEYAQLCQAQFEVLSATVGAARCAVYFRREHPLTGALEFVPVAVYPQSQSVWVVGQNGDLPIVGPRELPGSTPATTLIPSYPFVRQVCRSISLACAAFVLWRGVQVSRCAVRLTAPSQLSACCRRRCPHLACLAARPPLTRSSVTHALAGREPAEGGWWWWWEWVWAPAA